MPPAHAVGTGTARGHARSRSWPGSTPGSDELTPLPDKGPRAATPEDGAAALVPAGAALGLAMDALATLSLPSQSLARPSSLQQAISHGQQDETPQGPSRRVCPAAWLPPHIATLILRYFPAEQTGTRLSREAQETRHSNLPAPAPASPCHPGTALPHAAARGPRGTGQLTPARLLSPGDGPGLVRKVRWHTDARGCAHSSPRRAGCLCCRARTPHQAGVLQESTISPVPGWFYSLRGWDNGRKSPERGMRPGLGTKGPETRNQPRRE